MLKYIYTQLEKKRQGAKDEIEYEKSFLFDVYTFALIFLLGCNIFLNIVFLKQYVYAGLFGGLTLFMLSTLMWPDRIRFNKKLLTILFFFLGIVVFYCDVVGGEGCMNYLSYVSLTIAIAFFFDYSKDRYIIFFLISSYIIWFLLNIITDHSLFSSYKNELSPQNQWYVRVYKVIEISFCTFIGVYFISRKEKMIIKYHLEKEKLNDLIKRTDKINFSGELYELAMSKNSLFITYFKSEFPDFFDKILQVAPNLVSSELEICALLKLNLNTKEIASATNSTVRSIEGKKYRIRRKLNVPSETDINLFIINTF